MNLKNVLIDLPRWQKRCIVLACDVVLCLVSVWLAFYLRTGVFHALHAGVLTAMVMSVCLAVPIFTFTGLYRAVFRYEGFGAAIAIVQAMAMYSILYFALFTVIGLEGRSYVPRTIGIIQPAILFAGVALSRGFARFWLSDEYKIQLRNSKLPRYIIYGAGEAGRQLASVILETHKARLVGFVDDSKDLQKLTINGIKVYASSALKGLIKEFDVASVMLAIPSASVARRKAIISHLTELHVEVRTLPALAEIASGKISYSSLKPVSIEDLLRRDPVEPVPALLTKTITGKVVMVTGAGGSIGSELCRQIFRVGPKVLLLVERTEYTLYAIHQELTEKFPVENIKVIPLLADVKDVDRMREIMTTWGVNTVYHAAAYKHVPMVEHNPMEGIINNVYGTWRTAQVARECGVERFTLISTDKAVRPTNVMGASKRLCESILQTMAPEKDCKTIFTMVRFGNVLGSSGSVVPRFREQIKEGGPVTVTHEDINRYFMTIPEASQLVIQAASLGQGGDVFLLDMGKPIKIMDLAKQMIQLSGFTVKDKENPNGDIAIKVTGLRPGEKLYEELFVSGNPMPTEHPRIFYAKEVAKPKKNLLKLLEELQSMLNARDREGLRDVIQKCVPEYAPKGGNEDWVSLEEGEPNK